MANSSVLPNLHKIILTILTITMVFLVLIPVNQVPDSKFKVGVLYPVNLGEHFLEPAEEKTKPVIPAEELTWHKFKIQRGESLAVLFSRINLSQTLLYSLINSSKTTKSLAKLNIGDEISIAVDKNKRFRKLRLKKNEAENLVVDFIANDFISYIESIEIDTQLNFAASTIQSSFWNAGINAGLEPTQVMELARIFSWDIDFALDIRKGDHFEVLFEEKLREGEIVARGKILAAIFTNQGEIFTAIRSESGVYYDPQGNAMRKAFLRSPVNFRYVSSNFNPRRLHPVTGQLKAHRGTDYVAPVGTPIWAAGDGVVMKASYNKFNGNYVFIRHTSTYITKYLHLKKRKVKTGQRVRQGQTIGTLGSSGRVTGPHLHYEFLVNGRHKNPRTVSLPQARSLTGEEKAAFIRLAKERLEQLSKFSQLLAGLNINSLNAS